MQSILASMVRRLVFSLVGALLGLLAGGLAFYLSREPGTSFSYFLPCTFAGVFAVVSFVADEQFLHVLGEIVIRL